METETVPAAPGAAPHDATHVTLSFALERRAVSALLRFVECVSDAPFHDVSRADLHLLETIGLLRRGRGEYYEQTVLGIATLTALDPRRAAGQPAGVPAALSCAACAAAQRCPR